MAKRFADTRLSRKAWYRKLSSDHKALWRMLTDVCDHAGVWSIDEDDVEHLLGRAIPLADFIQSVNADGKERIRFHDRDKVFIPGFVEFQYEVGAGSESKKLNPKNSAHRGVVRELKRHGIDPSCWYAPEQVLSGSFEAPTKPLHRDLGLGSGYGLGLGEGLGKGGVGEKPPAPGQRIPPTQPQYQKCVDEWKATLAHFQIKRNLAPGEDVLIYNAATAHGAENVCLVFQGARKQVKDARYDPAQFVSLTGYLGPKAFNRLLNLGAGVDPSDSSVNWAEEFEGLDK